MQYKWVIFIDHADILLNAFCLDSSILYKLTYTSNAFDWFILGLPWPHPILGILYRNGNQPETESWKVKQCGSVKCQKPDAVHMSLCKDYISVSTEMLNQSGIKVT